MSLEDVTPPGKPGTPVVNNLTGTSVTLSWAAATDNVAVTGYLVSLDQSSPVAVSGTSHAFSNLKEATTYHVEVKARDAAGNLSDGAAVTFSTKDVTAPSRPGTPVVSDLSGSSATLSWTPSTDNVAVTGYLVSLDQSSPVTVSGTRHTFSNLKAATTYHVEVKARDAAGNLSDGAAVTFSIKDVTAPSRPGTPVVSHLSGSSATLSWTPSTDNVAVTGYLVSLDQSSPVVVSGTSHAFSNLKEATTYHVEVKARDAAGNLSDGAAVTFSTKDVTAPSRPGTPVVSDLSGSSATLSWTPSTDNVAVTGYIISLNNGSPVYITNPRHIFNGLREVTAYTAVINAYDAAGNFSPGTSVTFSTRDATKPTQPTGLVAGNVSTRAAALIWNRSSDNVGVTGYEILRDGQFIDTTKDSTPGYLAIGLIAGNVYQFSVRAIDAAGNQSETSASVRVSTPPIGPPRNVRTSVRPTRIDLAWNRPEDAIGLLGYRIEADDFNGSYRKVETPAQSVSLTLLKASTEYTVSISAHDASQFYGEPLMLKVTTPAN
nr:fibronectin type III domain-containing protein [Pseudomonas vancouverensis]